MTLTKEYTATSTDAYTITGTTPIKVTKVSGNDLISWNNTTKRIDIAVGLATGVYVVKLRAENSEGTYTFTFTLTIVEPQYYLDFSTVFVGGTVAVTTPNTNPYLAKAGDVITINVTPDAGYVLDEIQVYMMGTTVTVPVSGSGNTYTFTMPAGHITIVATFQTVTEIETISQGVKAYVQDGTLYVSELSAGQTWNVYNITGSLIYQGTANAIPLPERGVYVVRCEDKSIKVVY
jgi:hypothetical protein